MNFWNDPQFWLYLSAITLSIAALNGYIWYFLLKRLNKNSYKDIPIPQLKALGYVNIYKMKHARYDYVMSSIPKRTRREASNSRTGSPKSDYIGTRKVYIMEDMADDLVDEIEEEEEEEEEE